MAKFYSETYELFKGKIPPHVSKALALLGKDEIRVFPHKNWVCIPFEIEVSLPSKGTYNQIDIRSIENVLLAIELTEKNQSAPRIYSDRLDFPHKELPHLYVKRKNRPSCLCLVRGDFNEWYSEHDLGDIITVAKEWFDKASSGSLVVDGDEFDPIRLESYSGKLVYQYDDFYEELGEQKYFYNQYGFTFGLFAIEESDNFEYSFLKTISLIEINDDFKADLASNESSIKKMTGLIFWSGKEFDTNKYWGELPKNYQELKEFIQVYLGFDISKGFKLMKLLGIQNRNGIPIIVGIKRSKKLIGYSGNTEFLNFVLKGETENWVDEEPINSDLIICTHREPFSKNIAQKLTNIECTKEPTFIIGAGSLGSSFVDSIYRSGFWYLFISDGDKLEPHNLVRHVLNSDSLHKNKATELSRVLNNLSPTGIYGAIGLSKYCFFLKPHELNKMNWVIDTSASTRTLNWLISDNSFATRVIRLELAFQGKLGLMYIEGIDKKPRVDDLLYYTYYLGIDDNDISEWLIHEQEKSSGNEYDIVDIGLGCNSATTIMPIDSIQFHSSIFSKQFLTTRNEIESGKITISKISNNGTDAVIKEVYPPTFFSHNCQNGSGWTVRLTEKVIQDINSISESNEPNEVGGILIGLVNNKTKIIYVFDSIKGPDESYQSPVNYIRLTGELPKIVNKIKKRTGRVIGYVGEWHSHPMGLSRLSSTDMEAIDKLVPLNQKEGIPTLVIIDVNGELKPFVFE